MYVLGKVENTGFIDEYSGYVALSTPSPLVQGPPVDFPSRTNRCSLEEDPKASSVRK